MKKSGKLFRKKGGGYNKDDVNSYIIYLNDTFSEKYDDVNEKNGKLEQEIFSEKRKIEELKIRDDQRVIAEQKLKNAEDRIMELEARIKSLDEEITSLKDYADSIGFSVSEKVKRISELEQMNQYKDTEISNLKERIRTLCDVDRKKQQNSLFGCFSKK